MQTQLLKQRHFLSWKNSSSENPIKPTGFENSPKCPSSSLSLLVLVVSGLHKQADFLNIFLQKIAFTGDTMGASRAQMKKDGWMQVAEAFERDL